MDRIVRGYQCSRCGKFHERLPFAYGSPAPDLCFQIPQREREKRLQLTSNQCVVDKKHFFILGRIEIPVTDVRESFAWVVWVSLSNEDFVRVSRLAETPGRENGTPVIGLLETSLPCYGRFPRAMETRVHIRPIGQLPLIELEAADHPLAVEQRHGITLSRVQQIAEECLHV